MRKRTTYYLTDWLGFIATCAVVFGVFDGEWFVVMLAAPFAFASMLILNWLDERRGWGPVGRDR